MAQSGSDNSADAQQLSAAEQRYNVWAAKQSRLAQAVNPLDLKSRTVGGGRSALYLTGETTVSCVAAPEAALD